jgi:hypothetical protein
VVKVVVGRKKWKVCFFADMASVDLNCQRWKVGDGIEFMEVARAKTSRVNMTDNNRIPVEGDAS